MLEAFYFILPPPKREPREDELERMWRTRGRGSLLRGGWGSERASPNTAIPFSSRTP
jgi:hypothetical protein